MRKKCLGCGQSFRLSGSGRRQKYCQTCRSTSWRFRGFQPIENTSPNQRGFDTYTPDLSEYVRAAHKARPRNPVQFVIPDGRKAHVWLGSEANEEPKIGDDRHFTVNLAAADKLDTAEIRRQRRVWPVDIMGGGRMGKIERHIRYGILAVEHRLVDERPKALPLQGDDHALIYDANGDPELPKCLDRRTMPSLAEAA
jgi:hypothetical protein